VVLKWADPLPIMAEVEAAGWRISRRNIARTPTRCAGRLSATGRWGIIRWFQEYVRGRGLGQTLYMEGGKGDPALSSTSGCTNGRRRAACRRCARRCRSISHAEQMRLSERLLAAIGWDGYAMVEYRFDPRPAAMF
jgi:hypothetical protein